MRRDWLNLPVNGGICWVQEVSQFEFGNFSITAMPPTREKSASLHIDLSANRLGALDGRQILNELLSLCAWSSDHYAILGDGGSGSPNPQAVSRRSKSNLHFAGGWPEWPYARQPLENKEEKLAVGFYREAMNAYYCHSIPYACFTLFKIMEIENGTRGRIRWLNENLSLEFVNKHAGEPPQSRELVALNGGEITDFGRFLFDQCRNALAHAEFTPVTNPDNAKTVRSLSVCFNILRQLTRKYIGVKIGLSESVWDVR